MKKKNKITLKYILLIIVIFIISYIGYYPFIDKRTMCPVGITSGQGCVTPNFWSYLFNMPYVFLVMLVIIGLIVFLSFGLKGLKGSNKK